MSGTIEIRLWILSWGADVEVLAPASLRDDVADTHRRGRCAHVRPDDRRQPFAAVNLISDPIHGYVELTKRLAPDETAAAGLPDEDVAEEDLLDTAWLQRLRRISQLQSARWVFPTAEHSRFTHGLGVMHEAGLWARSLYPSLRADARRGGRGAVPSEGLVVETLRMAGLLHDVGHGPFAHFFDDHVLAAFAAPPDAAATGRQAADPRGPVAADHRGRARAAAARPATRARRRRRTRRASRTARRSTRPGSRSSSRSRRSPTRPCRAGCAGSSRCCRACSPSTTSTTSGATRTSPGVAVGPVDVERLRRYSFISERGLTLFEPGLPALEMFLTSRRFMYQQVYFHRTVRAIDLDLGEVFGPSIRAIFGDGSPAERLRAYADLDEYGAAPPGGPLGAWGGRSPIADRRATGP